jgi:hypothetical protein
VNRYKLDVFKASNLKAARLIAADPVKYPAGSLMAEWAEVVIDRLTEPWRPFTLPRSVRKHIKDFIKAFADPQIEAAAGLHWKTCTDTYPLTGWGWLSAL